MFLPFKKYPYQDYNAFNLDYLINEMKQLGLDYEAFVESNIIKYHDPITWDINTQYEANTIVSNEDDVYLSKKPVPAGVAVTNTDYWFKVGDISTYSLELESIRHQIEANDEGVNAFSSTEYAEGDIFWLNEYLCKAITDIASGDAFINGTNYTYVTVTELINNAVNSLQPEINANTNAINANTAAITELNKVVLNERYKNKGCILIGDSFGDGTGNSGTGWIDYFINQFSPSPVYQIRQNGGGVAAPGNSNASYPNMNYAQALSQLGSTLTTAQKNAVQYIIIQTGHNDVSSSRNPDGVAGVQTGMSALKTQITNFPNSKVIFAATYGTNRRGENKSARGWNILHYYLTEQAARNGWMTSEHAPAWFHGEDNLEYGDNIHLNGTGYVVLAGYMAALGNGWDGVNSFACNRGVGKSSGNTLVSGRAFIERKGSKVHLVARLNTSTDANYSTNSNIFDFAGVYSPGYTMEVPAFNIPSSSPASRGSLALSISAPDSNGICHCAIQRYSNNTIGTLSCYVDVTWDVDVPLEDANNINV